MTQSAQAHGAEVTYGHWRPRYHITGARNWINDPNGPTQWGGRYHLFFQANPDAPFWGSPQWGHVSSTDLAHWERHDLALMPSYAGPDADGCWSGCLRSVDGRPAIYYTGVVGDGDDRTESVCRAWCAPDLSTWTKDAANPLVPGPPAELGSGYHRDPFLWHDGSRWQMLVSGGTASGERHGHVLRYDSVDASTWRYRGVFFAAPRSLDGMDLGEHWECPQLAFAGDRVALIVSCQTPNETRPLLHAVSFVGSIVDGRFEGEYARRLDHGDVYYAPALTTDESGRTLLWGWAQEVVPATVQATMGHVGALSLPRVLSFDGQRVRTAPAPELDVLRLEPVAAADELGTNIELFGVLGRGEGWTLGSERVRLEVRADDTGSAIRVRVADSVSRERVLTMPYSSGSELRMFVDGSLVEIYVGGAALTTRAYWDTPCLEIAADGSSSPRAWRLDPTAAP